MSTPMSGSLRVIERVRVCRPSTVSNLIFRYRFRNTREESRTFVVSSKVIYPEDPEFLDNLDIL